jgi:ATP-dependent Lon protease
MGGDVLFVEAASMPGGKGFQLTGHLGDVMQESARAALSYVRARTDSLHVSEDYFETHDIHLHVPAGAVPKDGPSAGVTMATALASLLTQRPVRGNVAMTGEITLRGKVLPVGGIKDKVLAAHRFGLDTVILPQRNAQDLDELPDEVRETLTFVFAATVDDVLEAALVPQTEAVAAPQPTG